MGQRYWRGFAEMKISVNCPSYKRPKVKTLDYIPYCKVWVDCDEYQDYLEQNPRFAENIVSCPKGIQGNLCRIRNYILDKEFENGADVVCIVDDDLQGIYRFYPDKDTNFGYLKEKINADDLLMFIEKYSIMCEDLGYKFWGVNCNSDHLNYNHYTPFSTVVYIGGPFGCHLAGTEIRYDESLPLKENYDLALQHCNKYRGVLRVNAYHYDCKQSEQAGGCATYRNREREEQQLLALIKKWGSKIVKVDRSNKGKTNKQKMLDYNPIIKVPIKGV